MSKHDFKNVEGVRDKLHQLAHRDGKDDELVGMGVITFLASAIEKLAAEVAELKANR